MTCYHPLDGFRARTPGPSGKRAITFNPSEGYRDLPIQVPCGQCIGCRLEKSRQWALRCKHEASLYSDNCFLTLTYSDENLPENSSLCLRDFQLFIKRLRKKYGKNIKYYHCGEYGEKTNRPHYHALIFNFDFKDKTIYKIKNEQKYYISASLSKLWINPKTKKTLGHCVIGDLTFESAAYVARYCLKKITGKDSDKYYERFNSETGEIVKIAKEYATMSRRPGIGRDWYKKYQTDVYPRDYVVKDGVKMRPPKYYDRQLEITDPKEIRRIKALRKQSAAKHAVDNTPARLAVREKVQKAQAKLLVRDME